MYRCVVLLKFTEKGISNLGDTVKRAAAFQATAKKAGATVEGLFWTTGPYDGVLVMSAPDEATATSLVLRLGKGDNVTTCMLRAFDAAEFEKILEKMA